MNFDSQHCSRYFKESKSDNISYFCFGPVLSLFILIFFVTIRRSTRRRPSSARWAWSRRSWWPGSRWSTCSPPTPRVAKLVRPTQLTSVVDPDPATFFLEIRIQPILFRHICKWKKKSALSFFAGSGLVKIIPYPGKFTDPCGSGSVTLQLKTDPDLCVIADTPPVIYCPKLKQVSARSDTVV